MPSESSFVERILKSLTRAQTDLAMTAVQFINVSKQYRLGVTRVSLPSMITDRIKRLRSPDIEHAAQAQRLWALRDVSFDLPPGECLALIGPNGAGKTTILRLLSNISKPSKGTVVTRGRMSALLELGAGFHPDLTGRENIYLNAAILGLRKQYVNRRFDEIVDFSGLEEFIDTPIKRYSSGMVVRLGFSVAACIQPDILLVDEVLAVGDAAFQQQCLSRIDQLVKSGTGIIFVSHNLYMVQAICTRALYLQHGRVQALGGVREAIDIYERDVHIQRALNAKHATQKETAGDGEVAITAVTVSGTSPTAEGGVLLSDAPATITVHYNSASETGPINASIFIKRSDGLTCCMIRTSSNGHRVFLRRGTGVLSVYLDRLQLITGSYEVHAYFLNESDSLPLTPTAARSEWFVVKGSTLGSPDNSGVYEPLAKWISE